MHSFLVRLRNIDLIFFFPNDLCVRPPFISSTEMKWQPMAGCGISDVLVMAQHRFQAQHLCLPCQPLRLKVCLCPSISSAFSLGLENKGQALTLQVSAMSGNKPHWGGERKNPLNLCAGARPREDTRFVLCSSSTGGVSLLALLTVRCWGPSAPQFFSTANSQWVVGASIASEPPPWSSSVCVTGGCKEWFGNTELSN